MARPTDYNQEIVEKARDYLTTYSEKGKLIPSVAGLALHLNLARSTVYKWSGEEGKEEFSDIVSDLLAIQEEELVNNGLSGEFNSTITKLLLAKHGHSDRQEVSGPEGGPIEIDQTWQIEVVGE